MKRVSILMTLVLVLFVAACGSKPAEQKSTATGNAAMVGSEPVTMAELEDAAKSQLQRVETQVYQIKKSILDDLIEKKLIEQAAKKADKSVDDFIKAEITSKVTPPTEEEIKALYEARKGQIKQTFEEVKGQISSYLMQNKMNQLNQELIARLKKDTKVEVAIQPPRITIDVGDLPYEGEKDGKVTLVEFSDYQCPYCARVRPTIWKLVDEYKGKIKYVFIDNPLSFHKDAKKAHEAARCAGVQKKYYDYNRKIFDNQTDLSIATLKKYAGDLKLDQKKFDKCLDDGEMSKVVEENLAKGMSAGVSGTPAYFINGIMLSGAQPYDAFKQLIDSELDR